MLYYIKHEIIGDLVQHISDGVHVRFVKNIHFKKGKKIKTKQKTMLRFDPSLLLVYYCKKNLCFLFSSQNIMHLHMCFIQCLIVACAMYLFYPWDLLLVRGMTHRAEIRSLIVVLQLKQAKLLPNIGSMATNQITPPRSLSLYRTRTVDYM